MDQHFRYPIPNTQTSSTSCMYMSYRLKPTSPSSFIRHEEVVVVDLLLELWYCTHSLFLEMLTQFLFTCTLAWLSGSNFHVRRLNSKPHQGGKKNFIHLLLVIKQTADYSASHSSPAKSKVKPRHTHTHSDSEKEPERKAFFSSRLYGSKARKPEQ